jgi:hypothetical protein
MLRHFRGRAGAGRALARERRDVASHRTDPVHGLVAGACHGKTSGFVLGPILRFAHPPHLILA